MSESSDLPPLKAEEFLPLIYDELRRLAAHKLQSEKSPLSMQPTSLVHEVYLRLTQLYPDRDWSDRREFFVMSAEVMRRILIDRARSKNSEKHGGALNRIELPTQLPIELRHPAEQIALDDRLTQLEAHDPLLANYGKSNFFLGFTNIETAEALNLTRRQADRIWKLARAWLIARLNRPEAM